MKRSYQDIKEELQSILDWFESSEVDIDEAVSKHEQAEKLLAELDDYIAKAEAKLSKDT